MDNNGRIGIVVGYNHNADTLMESIMEKCCENCIHAKETGIDGLIDCEKDGRSKDCDMVCDEYEER